MTPARLRTPPPAATVRERGGTARDVRATRLERAAIGIVPILWNNADLPDPEAIVPAQTVLDDIARTGYEGTQAGIGFPSGRQLADELRRRDLRLAEVYVAVPAGRDGPLPDALEVGRRALDALDAADGEVLVVALPIDPARERRAGRATDPRTPQMTERGLSALGGLLDRLRDEASARGRRTAFHPHAGTFVETPEETERLLGATSGAVDLCLDVGHWTVAGGDPVGALRRYGERVTHVHLKDVAPRPLGALRDGRLGGFLDAIRARLFTELGAGILDLDGIVGALDERGYAGWIMVEQDTTWSPPTESAAISRRVLDYAIRHHCTVDPR